MTRTFDLNDPDDARDWLTTLEADGQLTFDTMETAQDLDDEEALEVASTVFQRFNKIAGVIEQ